MASRGVHCQSLAASGARGGTQTRLPRHAHPLLPFDTIVFLLPLNTSCAVGSSSAAFIISVAFFPKQQETQMWESSEQVPRAAVVVFIHWVLEGPLPPHPVTSPLGVTCCV